LRSFAVCCGLARLYFRKTLSPIGLNGGLLGGFVIVVH